MPNEPQSEYRWRIIKEAKDQQKKPDGKQRDDQRHKKQNWIVRVICEICGQAKRDENKEDRRWRTERNLHIGEIIALTAAAVVGIAAIVVGSYDTHESIFAANRAWLAPTFMSLSEPLEQKTDISFNIRIANVGREPANNVIWNINPLPVDYIPQDNNKGPDKFGRNDTCNGLKPKNTEGIAIYPVSVSTNFFLPYSIEKSDDLRIALLGHSKSLIVEGCFAYLTSDADRHASAFRFFLRDIWDKPSCSFHRDLAGNQQFDCDWRFNGMTTGNEAN